MQSVGPRPTVGLMLQSIGGFGLNFLNLTPLIQNPGSATEQEDCSSIWGQQLRRRGHQTESSSVLQEDRIYPSIEVVDPRRTNVSPYNSHADTQARPHEATCTPVSIS